MSEDSDERMFDFTMTTSTKGLYRSIDEIKDLLPFSPGGGLFSGDHVFLETLLQVGDPHNPPRNPFNRFEVLVERKVQQVLVEQRALDTAQGLL